MPIVLLERLPLPSLKAYTSFSVLLLSFAVYCAHQIVLQEIETAQNNATSSVVNKTSNETEGVANSSIMPLSAEEYKDEYTSHLLKVLLEETWCVWTLINMAYCCLILTGKMIQKAVFGELRVSEQQHIKDKFWNFVFYKFIFIFGVMNVQNMDEVIMWCAWFSMLGFLHLLAQLCKDRFEYLSFSPTTPRWTHAKVLGLLVAIGTVCIGLTVFCGYVGMVIGINTFAFMAAECVLLIIKTLHVIFRYGIHLWDLNYESVWESRAIYVYYTQLIFELAALSVDFAHHLHMLVWGNIFLSMASLVICMQLRYLFHEFQRRIKRHKNYLRVVNSMESRFPMATKEELNDDSDDCAICWDKMETARKLPCGHMFHNACLRSWLEQDTSCPTCRTGLNDTQTQPGSEAGAEPAPNVAPDREMGNPNERPLNQTTNHFFHFDGSRYVSWLPSFSVEVTHTQIMGNARLNQVQTSQLDNMARQVQSVFPSMPLNVIMEDLRITRSVEQSIDNILEGRLVVPQTLSRSISDQLLTDGEEPSPEAQPAEASASISPPGGAGDGRQGLNFIMDDNLPSLEPEEISDEEQDVQAAQGYRFSKSSSEREAMLFHRKESLLQQARRKYMSKHKMEDMRTEESEMPSQSRGHHRGDGDASRMSLWSHLQRQASNSVGEAHEIRQRRERAYEAARRRMEGN